MNVINFNWVMLGSTSAVQLYKSPLQTTHKCAVQYPFAYKGMGRSFFLQPTTRLQLSTNSFICQLNGVPFAY